MAFAITARTAAQEKEKHFQRWGYDVSGWFTSPGELRAQPGVFIVATQGFLQPFVLDIDQADNIRFAAENHERRRLWKHNALGGLMFAAVYTDAQQSHFLNTFEREKIVDAIRLIEEPVCRSVV
jgi:hypothetical protein